MEYAACHDRAQVLSVLDGAAHVGDGLGGGFGEFAGFGDVLVVDFFACEFVVDFSDEEGGWGNGGEGDADAFKVAVVQGDAGADADDSI